MARDLRLYGRIQRFQVEILAAGLTNVQADDTEESHIKIFKALGPTGYKICPAALEDPNCSGGGWGGDRQSKWLFPCTCNNAGNTSRSKGSQCLMVEAAAGAPPQFQRPKSREQRCGRHYTPGAGGCPLQQTSAAEPA